MHEEEVDARTIAVLALAAGVAFLTTGPRLPADAAQGLAFFFGELVPLVAGGVPQLVKQAVLGRNQPGQQGRVEADALAGFGEQLFVGDKTVVAFGQRQGPLKVEDVPAEGGAAGIAEIGPDFIQGHLEFIGRHAAG